MGRDTTDTPVIRRVRELVEPIASDLQLDIYDVEQRGGTMRVTLDTPAGSDSSVDLDQLALATRLISREFDHHDPIPGKYTLEVTSPGVERTLRTPAHFQREIGKEINVRLTNVDADQR
ncbi:MAG: ribosome maturation factor RimP, partial [Ilumatobacter sp.]|nr:ribosome maturation factor RimP [Ilumatobacter sp.]